MHRQQLSGYWLQLLLSLKFYLLINASKSLLVGTAYAVFVGLGTTGVTIFDVLVFAHGLNIGKVILIFTLLLGVIGLKLVTTNKGEEV